MYANFFVSLRTFCEQRQSNNLNMRHIFLFIVALCASVAWATEPLSGIFTVNEQGDQVQFAPGNLQYVPSTGVWQFATSQTESIGKDAAYITANPGYEGAIDLFTWSEDLLPVSLAQQGWRMLTSEEWAYLLREEEIGDGPMNAGQATIGTQHGLMLVPDDWQEFATLTFAPSPNNWTTNSYTAANWEQLETSGVVFLPCVGDAGTYWSATPKDASDAYGIHFYETSIAANTPASRTTPFSVRLVKDVKETPTGIDNDGMSASLNDGMMKILRNGQIYLMYKGTMYNVQGNRFDSLSR
jgi:hypothetical protein